MGLKYAYDGHGILVKDVISNENCDISLRFIGLNTLCLHGNVHNNYLVVHMNSTNPFLNSYWLRAM